MIRSLAAFSAALFLSTAPAMSQSAPFNVRYDDTIPTLESFAGHDFGGEVTRPEQAIAYIRALEAAAPERVEVFSYATSWEGRELVYAVIGSPERMADLDRVREGMAALANPGDLTAAERDRLIEEMPIVVWLSYGVHGDEISPTGAGLRTAYHLLAAEGDETVETIFDNALIIIDPTQNPDGRARFVNSFESARGLEPSPDRYAVEHDQPWPRGRYNHYLFDLNRDWFALTQPETRGKVREMQVWWPQIVVDSHEMSGDSTYFFAPSAEPFNPNIEDNQRRTQELIGRNHVGYFDELGYHYFTREVYDAFYPGYGDMWPTLQGAVAMTYEQGSARGLSWRRPDGSILTYGDGVDRNFVTSLSTIEAAARNRVQLLGEYTDFRASGGRQANGNAAAVFDASTNSWNADRLARQLAYQGITVERLEGRQSLCGASFDDGAYVVRYDQPAGRLARTLLEPTTDLPTDFVDEQERRREAGLNAQLYDVTAWALPLMSNVRAVQCRRAPGTAGTIVNADGTPQADLPDMDASWGYAIPWDDAGQAHLVAALARDGVSMRTTSLPFRIGNETYPTGSVVVPRRDNGAELDFLITRHARESGAEVHAMDTSWVDEGPNPGSSNFSPVIAPRIALLWGQGTGATETGATRYVLERRYNLPVTIIRPSTIGRADLDRFDVIIMPDQGFPGYTSMLSGARSALQSYVSQGGVLVGLGTATRWLSDSDNGFLPMQRERAVGTPRDSEASSSGVTDGSILNSQAERLIAEAVHGAMPDSSPGALVSITANTDSWMSAGYEDGAYALVTGSDIYAPVALDDATTAMRFGTPEELLQGGYLWAEYAEQLALKPFVVTRRMGRGHVIAFTQSPTTRAYLDGLDLLLLNAVLLGPANSNRLR